MEPDHTEREITEGLVQLARGGRVTTARSTRNRTHVYIGTRKRCGGCARKAPAPWRSLDNPGAVLNCLSSAPVRSVFDTRNTLLQTHSQAPRVGLGEGSSSRVISLVLWVLRPRPKSYLELNSFKGQI